MFRYFEGAMESSLNHFKSVTVYLLDAYRPQPGWSSCTWDCSCLQDRSPTVWGNSSGMDPQIRHLTSNPFFFDDVKSLSRPLHSSLRFDFTLPLSLIYLSFPSSFSTPLEQIRKFGVLLYWDLFFSLPIIPLLFHSSTLFLFFNHFTLSQRFGLEVTLLCYSVVLFISIMVHYLRIPPLSFDWHQFNSVNSFHIEKSIDWIRPSLSMPV